MLSQRIATALVLLLVLIGALAAGPHAFLPLCGLLLGVAAAEWFRLSGTGTAASVALAVALVGALAIWVAAAPPAGRIGWGNSLLLLAVGVWLGIAALLVRAERTAVRLSAGAVRLAGAVLLAAAGIALLRLYAVGVIWLISVMALVWIADIAAYFTGRAFGRRKLAPRISPGKTWAGVGGAMGAVILVSALAAWLWPDAPLFSTALLLGPAPALALVGLVVLTALSIVGDLFESLLKRQAGVKDSSKLLPGHGGVLDRIDAQLPVLPAAALIQWWIR